MRYQLLADENDPSTQPLDMDYKTPLMQLINYGAWIVMILCFVGVLITAARLALAYRNGGPEKEIGALAAVLAGCLLMGSAGAIVSGFIIPGGWDS